MVSGGGLSKWQRVGRCRCRAGRAAGHRLAVGAGEGGGSRRGRGSSGGRGHDDDVGGGGGTSRAQQVLPRRPGGDLIDLSARGVAGQVTGGGCLRVRGRHSATRGWRGGGDGKASRELARRLVVQQVRGTGGRVAGQGLGRGGGDGEGIVVAAGARVRRVARWPVHRQAARSAGPLQGRFRTAAASQRKPVLPLRGSAAPRFRDAMLSRSPVQARSERRHRPRRSSTGNWPAARQGFGADVRDSHGGYG